MASAARWGRWLAALALLLGNGLALGQTAWTDDVLMARRLLFAEARTEAMVRDAAGLLERSLNQLIPERRRGEVCYLLGRARCELKDSLGAVTMLRQAVTDEPRNSLYRLWLATAYQLDGRTTLALRELRAVEADVGAEQAERKTAREALAALHEAAEAEPLAPKLAMAVPGATIRYEQGDPTAADVREALAAARRRLEQVTGLRALDDVEILVFPSRERYLAYHEARTTPRPEWSTACASGGRISLYGDGAGRDALISTLSHEYAHIALRAAAGDRPLPCWLDEGLAVMVSAQFPDYRLIVAQAPALLDLEALSVPSFGAYGREDARLAYAQSRAMAESLLRLGTLPLGVFLRALGAGQDVDNAFGTAYGQPLGLWFAGWLVERANG